MKKLVVIWSLLFSIQGITQDFDYAQLDSFLANYVTESGQVNYKLITTKDMNPILNQFVKTAPTEAWSKDETLAYWINAYNIFTIKLIADNYPVKSIKDIEQPWDQKFIPIGGQLLSLNQIEHDIIRKMNEPRIHFALVCAAVSCPKLYNKAFQASTLDGDLNMLTASFLANSTKNSISENELEISKIFQWFTGDFKTKERSLIDFLNQYSSINIAADAKIRFKDYNWSLNE